MGSDPLWLRLKVRGENISPVSNQSPEIVPVTLHGYIDSVGVNMLRRKDKRDPGPDWLRSGLQPNSESGGLQSTSPVQAPGL